VKPEQFLRPNTGELITGWFWLREMEGQISQYNMEKEKTRGKENERENETHLAQRDGGTDLCRARKGNSKMKTTRGCDI
jgi:hypothetical protein